MRADCLDAVALLVSEEGAALMAEEASVRDFVADAFAHRKFREALLVPARNHRSKVDRRKGTTGKTIDGERVADGSAVALKREQVRGAKGPCGL